MVMVLEIDIVEQMNQIGWRRYPNEAGGILLPIPINGTQVIELTNTSSEPRNSLELDVLELSEKLAEAVGSSKNLPFPWSDLTLWHTHPGGNVGPSPYDISDRPAGFKCLVVTLRRDQPALATWY